MGPNDQSPSFESVLEDIQEAADERAAIMEHEGEVPRREADVFAEDFKRDCLARWFVQPGLEARRRESWRRMVVRHGSAWEEDMKRRIRRALKDT